MIFKKKENKHADYDAIKRKHAGQQLKPSTRNNLLKITNRIILTVAACLIIPTAVVAIKEDPNNLNITKEQVVTRKSHIISKMPNHLTEDQKEQAYQRFLAEENGAASTNILASLSVLRSEINQLEILIKDNTPIANILEQANKILALSYNISDPTIQQTTKHHIEELIKHLG